MQRAISFSLRAVEKGEQNLDTGGQRRLRFWEVRQPVDSGTERYWEGVACCFSLISHSVVLGGGILAVAGAVNMQVFE